MEKSVIPQEFPQGRACRTCQWMGILQTVTGGSMICRKCAPRVFAIALPKPSGLQWASTSAWPDVSPTDWCGDYQKRQTEVSNG